MSDETNHPDPPKKRYSVTIKLDAHSPDHAADILRRIATDMDIDQRIPINCASGSGYWLRSEETPDALPEGEYEDALIAWHRATRAERRNGANPSGPDQ
jgi:hypothetical protein